VFEQLGFDLQERGERIDPGVVDKDVQAAEALDRFRQHRLDVGSLADVCF
jgi:hypothetical protein